MVAATGERRLGLGVVGELGRPAGSLSSSRYSGWVVRPMLGEVSEGMPHICYWFVVTGTPQGGAPVEVRAQWNGVALPVREPRPVEGPTPFRGREIGHLHVRHEIDDGVPVHGDDAVQALWLFGRMAASRWWRAYFGPGPTPDRLVFRSHEGRMVPPRRAVALFPELADFDDR